MEDYTVVITSCGRLDLLERTLESLCPKLTGPLAEILIIEDSGDATAFDVAGRFDQTRVLLNETNRGQHASIDRAYDEVKTEWVFHCEDDWDFFAPGFLEPSFTVMQAEPSISMLNLRGRGQENTKLADRPTESVEDIAFFRADPARDAELFGYSFNPGLRRMADFRLVAPIARFSDERYLSYCFKKLGFVTAYLETPYVRHLGDDRHVQDATRDRRTRSQFLKLGKSLRKKFLRARRKYAPGLDPTERLVREIVESRDYSLGS